MKVRVIGHLVCFGEQPYGDKYFGYYLKHMKTAIRRLQSGKPYYLASPIYKLTRQEVGALLANADKILNSEIRK